MKIDILTLFPDMFLGFKNESIIKRAIDEKKVSINTINFRDFAKNKHKKVDDTPFGGGNGMVLMCQPIFDAVNSVKKENTRVILLSPQGKKYNQKKAYELSKEKHIVFICGHYEGFDERIRTICDEEISVGDYVLTGGEIPSMLISDSIIRLIPGVIEEGSHLNDSFNNNLLDYPTYTKPRNFKGMKVPEVLLSGDHKKIEKWRLEKQKENTKLKRPDLLLSNLKLNKMGLIDKTKKISIDDIKDIKVIPINDEINATIVDKEINKNEVKNKNKKETKKKKIVKTGNYKIVKTELINAITIFNPKLINGYRLKGKTKSKKVDKILIVKNDFIKKIASKNIKKKIDILVYRFNLALSSDDDDETTSNVLGEAEMLKQLIINMYSNYLGVEYLDNIIKNINTLVNEFLKAKTLKCTLINEEEKHRVR